MRITRHPQMVGQVMWSAAHLAMVGSTFTFLTMILLVGHHVFAVWNGDRRLYEEHGERFEAIRDRTSVAPFAAILDGRQVLPSDYWKELVRAPYALIAVGTLGAYPPPRQNLPSLGRPVSTERSTSEPRRSREPGPYVPVTLPPSRLRPPRTIRLGAAAESRAHTSQ